LKPLVAEELWDLHQYELEREAYRAFVIAMKRDRRVSVGPQATFVFENRDTVRAQVQEMLRVERIVKPDAIQAELDIYNDLLPGPHELSATLMIEITDMANIRSVLDRLIGLDEHVTLRIGEHEVRATFDPKQFEADRIAAVQYVRFPLGLQLATQFAQPDTQAILQLDHPNYSHATELTGAARRSLIADLEV